MIVRCQAELEQLSQNLINQLEAMLVILEEGIQLLSSSTYGTEFSILEEMWKNLVHYLRLMIYGFNDTTIPPVSVLPYSLPHSGSIGQLTIILNFEMIELMRTGYTWTDGSKCIGNKSNNCLEKTERCRLSNTQVY